MVVLKHKKVRHFKFRDQRRQVEQPMTPGPRRTYIGTVTVAPGETFAVALPADLDSADPAAIRKAIEAAEAEKAEETRRLREFVGLGEKGDGHG